jgi:hypothetical protein
MKRHLHTFPLNTLVMSIKILYKQNYHVLYLRFLIFSQLCFFLLPFYDKYFYFHKFYLLFSFIFKEYLNSNSLSYHFQQLNYPKFINVIESLQVVTVYPGNIIYTPPFWFAFYFFSFYFHLFSFYSHFILILFSFYSHFILILFSFYSHSLFI